jgi:hypothetical protein
MRFPGQLHTVFGAVVVVAALASSPQAFAQTAPTMSRVTITHVKPEMSTEWFDLQKNEVVPALKKGGEKTRTVYVTALFGPAGEYVTVSPIENFAQFDGTSPILEALGQPGTARLNEKLRKCIVNSMSFESMLMPELSNVPEGAPPPILVQARYRIAPGKWQDFASIMQSDVLPVYKKANVHLRVSRRGAGANPNEVVVSTGYAKFADWGGGPFLTKAVGQAAADKINAKFTGTRVLVEVVARRRVPELSF